MFKNSLGRDMPKFIKGYGSVVPYDQIQEYSREVSYTKIFKPNLGLSNKLVKSIKDVIKAVNLKNGMTISFHHHLRDGDYVLNMVMDEIASAGIKDITICASSLINVHEPLIEHIKNGVVTEIHTSGIRGKLGKEISYNNILGKPVIFRTHGGRARAIRSGDVKIDVAFVAASAADKMGNCTGKIGKSKFGSMGYPMVDADYADKTVVITDNLVEYPLYPISIDQTKTDYVVVVDAIGDPTKISSGAIRITDNEVDLKIASYAASALIASGYIKDNFSFQAGSGGASLAVIKFIKEYMKDNNIKGSFASGGITAVLTELLEEGYFKSLIDTQTFDNNSADSLVKNANHIEMSADMYANPFNKSCVVNSLDIMVLSATEVDVDFNINVLTGSHGVIMGAQGGHPDTAEGAKLRIVTAPLIRKNIPIVTDQVTTIVTPGEHNDIIVTDHGISVNPRRQDLKDRFLEAGLQTIDIEELRNKAYLTTGSPKTPKYDYDTIVGVVESRHGSVIDIVYKVIE